MGEVNRIEAIEKLYESERAAHAETRAKLSSARVRGDYWKKRMAECGVCTPAERKVLEAWQQMPLEYLRAWASFAECPALKEVAQAELAKRGPSELAATGEVVLLSESQPPTRKKQVQP